LLTTGLKKIPILEMFGEDGEFPGILHVIARGDENLPKKYKDYPTFYCLVTGKPERPLADGGFEVRVIHVLSAAVLYLDEKTEVFE